MANYHFKVREYINGQYKNYTEDVELTDTEYRNIKSDDSKYSKCSELLSSKLGRKVESSGFPTEIKSSNGNGNDEGKSKSKKSSLWRPLWALPFKLIWRLITGF